MMKKGCFNFVFQKPSLFADCNTVESNQYFKGGFPMLHSTILKHPEKTFNATSTFVMISDGDGAIVWMNDACERCLGYSLSDLKGTTHWPFFATDDEKNFAFLIRQTFAGNTPESLVIPVICPDRTEKSIRWNTMLIQDAKSPKQKSAVVFGVLNADETRTQMDLKSTEERYRLFFENVGIGMIYVGEDSNIVLVNKEFEKLTGYSKAGVEGKIKWTALVPYEDDLKRMKEFHRLRSINPALAPTAYDAKIKHENGDILDVIVRVTIVPETTYRLVSLLDMTQERKAQNVIRENEARYRSLVDNMQDGLYRCDSQGNLTFCNPSAARLVGYDRPEELIGRNIANDFYYSPDQRDLLLKKLEMQGQVANYEVTLKHKDGSPIIISTNTHLFHDQEGNVLGIEGLYTDITQRKKAEKEIRRLAAIVRHSRELINLATPDGYIVFQNEASAKILGIDPDHVCKTNILQVLPDHLKPLMRDEIMPALARGENWEGDLQYINLKTGALTDVHAFIFPMEDPDMPDQKYLANISLDISQGKLIGEKFTKVFMMTPNCVAITKVSDGLLIDVNRGFEDITGWKRSEAIGRTSLEINFWADSIQRNQMVEDLKAGRDVLNREFNFRKKDSSVRNGIYSARSIHIAGEPHLVFVLDDITRRKETEKILKENEERLHAITGNVPGVVYQFYSTDGGEYGISYTSGRMVELFGVSGEDDLFSEFLARVHEDDRERFMTSIRKAAEAGTSWNFEGRFVKPSGELVWFNSLSMPTRYEDRLVFNGILLDITERKKMEEMTRQSEEKFYKVFATTPDCIAITRMADEKIIDVNRGFEDITGWKHDEVVGRTGPDINFWTDLAERDRMMHELKAGRDVLHRETQFRCKDGTSRSVIYSARTIHIAGESCMIFVWHDITEQRRLEKDHRELEAHLSQSQKMDAIGQLASGVAHDFNNILTGIQGNASLVMMEYNSNHPHYRKLTRIEENVKRGANLTRQLLGFARGGKYEVKTLDINELIRKNAQLFTETRKEIETDFQLQDGVYPIDADAGQLEQVLLNIYINAGHAMPKGGYLHIQTDNVTMQEKDADAFKIRPGDYVRISIADAGTGMDQVTLNRIFEPFFTTKSQQGGTGLGLASAYGIIRNHGGAISAHSEPGHGSTFIIYLPSSRQEVASEDQEAGKRLVRGSGGILLVDDEPLILGAMSDMLKMLGYTVYQAGSGQEAVSLYMEKRNAIDLVILDMILPGISGAQVLKMIKDVNPAVRVILSSGYSMQGEVRNVMEMGCAGFIQKPYSFADLSSVVHEAMGSLRADAG